MLLRQLPESARTRVAVTDPDVLEDAPWNLTNLLLASVVDTLNLANWQRGGKGKRPRPIPRPGTKPVTRRYGRPKRPQAWVLAELAKRAPSPAEEVGPA